MTPLEPLRTADAPSWGPRANRLLAALPAADYLALRSALEPVTLPVRQVLYEPGDPITHVYLPTTAVVSLMILGEAGTSVETARVGSDGVVGLPIALGLDHDTNRAICEIAGGAWRLGAGAFRAALARGEALTQVTQRYTQLLLVQMGQGAACNRLHTMYARCARWLLETHDRVDGDTFPVTQDFLSAMFCVRRATVTVTAGTLQEAGMIRYRRGHVTIVDRVGLEAAACECYRVVAEATAWLMGRPGLASFPSRRSVQADLPSSSAKP
jgi:CRP-like cAMP-binding protein